VRYFWNRDTDSVDHECSGDQLYLLGQLACSRSGRPGQRLRCLRRRCAAVFDGVESARAPEDRSHCSSGLTVSTQTVGMAPVIVRIDFSICSRNAGRPEMTKQRAPRSAVVLPKSLRVDDLHVPGSKRRRRRSVSDTVEIEVRNWNSSTSERPVDLPCDRRFSRRGRSTDEQERKTRFRGRHACQVNAKHVGPPSLHVHRRADSRLCERAFSRLNDHEPRVTQRLAVGRQFDPAAAAEPLRRDLIAHHLTSLQN
jgi:hypothetical protein